MDEFNDLEIASKLEFDAKELTEHAVSTLEEIEDLIDNKIIDSVEIAKNLNLPVLYIEKLSFEYGLPVTLKRGNLIALIKLTRLDRKEERRGKRKYKIHKKPKTKGEKVEHIEKIDKFVMKGADFSVMESASGLESKELRDYLKATDQYKLWETQFSERTGIKITNAFEIRIKKPVESKRKKKPKTETPRDLNIDKLIPDGLTLNVMADICGKNISHMLKYLNETDQHSKWKTARLAKKEPLRNPKLDELIEKGAVLREMKEVAGYESREGVRQYIIKTNQYQKWNDAKEKPKLEEQQRKSAIGKVIELAQKYLYQKSDRIEQKVFEFFMSTRSRRITPEQIRIIYTRYFEAKNAEKKLSLAKLGEGLHLCAPEIGRILKNVRLEPLFGKREKNITPQWKKEAIKRAFNLDANPPDIAYFLELPKHIIYQNMKMIGPRPTKQEFIAKPLANTRLPDLTYRLASQIYEARDLEFKTQEITELLNIKKRVVNYMLKCETIISPKIIEILKTLYPDKNITTPYIQTK